MVRNTIPIKYAVPTGSARTRLLTALAARYTGGTVRGWDVWDGLDTHPASQNSGRFGYSFGKTRTILTGRKTLQRKYLFLFLCLLAHPRKKASAETHDRLSC